MCSFASFSRHHFSLRAREGITHVGELVQVILPHVAPTALRPSFVLGESRASLSRSVHLPPSETVSLTVAATRLFHKRQRASIMVPNIPFRPKRLSIRVPFEQRTLHGVWSARCACTRTETNSHFARYFSAGFVISSTPMPSRRRGPTDKYDGEAHIRKSSAGGLQRGAALRLFPFASSFAVLKRIVLALVTMFMFNGSRGGVSAWNSRSVSLMSTTCAFTPSPRARHRHVSFSSLLVQ